MATIPSNDAGNRLVSIVDGASFPYDPSDSRSRKAAVEKLNRHGAELIAKLETIAGKRLSYKEIMHGLDRVDNRSTRERMAQETRKVRSERPGDAPVDPADNNPFRRVGPRTPKNHAGPVDRAERWAAAERAHDEQKGLEEARRRFSEDPIRQAKLKAAEQKLFMAKYDPNIDVARLTDLQHLVELARVGDLHQYDREADTFAQWESDRDAEQRAAIDSQIAALKAKRDAIQQGGEADDSGTTT